ncbi:MAG: hypothetical protein J0H78_03320 [Rhizobiales bacterium]|nr:hypothetical protein [Hyphomicrobiales bacterium]MBX3550837.1 hypothetical protein [Pseudolabrys sp.]MCW5682768.1 hypothetical protein [Pseudolabrys sp.]OJY42996.1 MAG: hypothetical protein BGP08_20085 [Rhizobiales bacterium 64-17]
MKDATMTLATHDDLLPYHESPPLAGYVRPRQSADLASTMAERIMAFHPASDAEALKLLRASFPNSPLSLRVTALDFLNRRRAR